MSSKRGAHPGHIYSQFTEIDVFEAKIQYCIAKFTLLFLSLRDILNEASFSSSSHCRGGKDSLPSKALSSPFTSISCQLLCYSVPQASQDACRVVPGSLGIAMLLTPWQVFILAATLDQILCGIIPSGGSSPFSVLAGVAEQIHILWGDGKCIVSEGRVVLG